MISVNLGGFTCTLSTNCQLYFWDSFIPFRIILFQLKWNNAIDCIDISCVLDIVSCQVTTIHIGVQWLCITSCACLLPVWPCFTIATRYENVAICETIEFLQIFSSSFALESFNEDEILTMFQGCVLDIFNWLEKWWCLSLNLSLLFCLVASLGSFYL